MRFLSSSFRIMGIKIDPFWFICLFFPHVSRIDCRLLPIFWRVMCYVWILIRNCQARNKNWYFKCAGKSKWCMLYIVCLPVIIAPIVHCKNCSTPSWACIPREEHATNMHPKHPSWLWIKLSVFFEDTTKMCWFSFYYYFYVFLVLMYKSSEPKYTLIYTQFVERITYWRMSIFWLFREI